LICRHCHPASNVQPKRFLDSFLTCFSTRSDQSIKIDKSVSNDKLDLVGIDCIGQSVKIDDALVLSIDFSWFLPIWLIYIGRVFCLNHWVNHCNLLMQSRNNRWTAHKQKKNELNGNSTFFIDQQQIKKINAFHDLFWWRLEACWWLEQNKKCERFSLACNYKSHFIVIDFFIDSNFYGWTC
jgi:hypothetical protein